VAHKSLWEDDAIQFPRLLAEIRAIGLTNDQVNALSESMCLYPSEIFEVLERAEIEFQNIKNNI